MKGIFVTMLVDKVQAILNIAVLLRKVMTPGGDPLSITVTVPDPTPAASAPPGGGK